MSSGPRKDVKSVELWRRLALLRDGEYCKADWERRLGGPFVFQARLLDLLPGTVADSFPEPQSGLTLVPRLVHDGTFTARPDDPDDE